MENQRILVFTFDMIFSLLFLSAVLYERKKGKTRKLNRGERSILYLVSGVQWLTAGAIFLFSKNSYLDNPNNSGYILWLLSILLVGVPLLLILIEWIAYELSKGTHE